MLVDGPEQRADDGVAAANRVFGAVVGFDEDGGHGGGSEVGREYGDEFGESTDAEQFECVVEVCGVVGGEVGGQGAVLWAFFALVFTSGATWGLRHWDFFRLFYRFDK